MKKLVTTATTILTLVLTGPALANDRQMGPSIATSGNGIVEVAPDMVTLSLEVDAVESTALAAKKTVDDRVNALYAMLDEMEINPLQVDAATLVTMPQFDYSGQQRRLQGYRASRSIQVKLYNLDRLSPFINRTLALKINQIQGMNFANKDAEGYIREARQLAVRDSKLIAAELAQAYDARLGPVYRISYRESTPPGVMPAMMRGKMMMAEAADQGYAKQKIRYHETVDVTFSLAH